MKKIFLILVAFSILLVSLELKKNSMEINTVMDYTTYNNNYYDYDINFEKENLNLENFKLKLATFTSYNYKIKRIYPEYEEKYKEYFYNKEYFIFDSNNMNKIMDDFRKEYLNKIKESNLNNDIDSITDNYINIKKVRVYTNEYAISKFKNKYPNAIVNRIEYNK